MKRSFTLVLFLVVCLCLRSQTVTLSAIYSGSTSPSVKTAGDVDSIADGIRRGFMKFDLSGLPPSAVITSADIQYYHYSGGLSGVPNSIYALSNDPATTAAGALYLDCGDVFPANGKLAGSVTWVTTAPSTYTTLISNAGVDYLNTRVGTWAGIALKRDTGGTIPYNFRGYNNATNPPKLNLTYYVPPACSGVPTAGTATASTTVPCTNEQVTLSLSGTTIASGLAFQWQSANIGSGSWSNISGATLPTYSFNASTSLDYRGKVTCTSASTTDSSNVVTVKVGGITTFPYSENFELSNGGWRGVDLGGGFSEWVWGAPTKVNINGAINGSKCWNTNLDTDYTDLMDYALESPCFNLTSVTSPRISFSMRYLTEIDYDGLFLEYSTNSGGSWTKVPSSAIVSNNSYNSNSTIAIFTPPAWSGDNGNWQRYVVYLPAIAGASTAKIRIHFQSDNYVTDEGVGFDSVSISNNYNDITLSTMTSPVSACTGSPLNPVRISLTNLGIPLNAGTKIPVYYSINGGTAVSDTITLTVNKQIGDTIGFTFKTQASLISFGNYNFKIWSALPGDAVKDNDTLKQTVTIFTISSLPYRENFESSDGGWVSKPITGTVADFIWGTPGKVGISSAASGSKCWVTRLVSHYNNLSEYALESPCMNLTNIVAPVMSFSLRFSTELSSDGFILESSINGGSSWTKVTNFIQGGYNNVSPGGTLPPPWWSGSSGGWQRVKIALNSYAGQGSVKFRLHFSSDLSFWDEGVAFDSVVIQDLFSKDVGVTAITSPAGGCGLSTSTTVGVRIKNFGKTLPVGTKIPVAFKLIDINSTTLANGKDTLTLTATLNSYDSVNFLFTPKVNLSVPGVYYFKSWTALPNDSDNYNDTIFNIPVISRSSVSTFPYNENFELSDGNWYGDALNGSINNEWGWNFPSKPVINFTPNGQQCWMTNPFNNYANNSDNALFSPCFDFSGMVNPEIHFLMRFRFENNNDAMILESSTNNGQSWSQVDKTNTQGNYNNNSVAGGMPPPKWSGDNATWKQYRFNLANLAMQPNVQLRFRFYSNASFVDEGAAIDSVVVFDNATRDIGLVAVTSPISNCGLSANETVSIQIKNIGNLPIAKNDTIVVSYRINNGTPVNENYILPFDLTQNSSIFYNFNTPSDLSAPGSYNFKISIGLRKEDNRLNDTVINYIVSTKSLIGTLPYLESFTGPSGNWTASGNPTEQWRITSTMVNPSLTPYSGSYMAVFSADSFSMNASSKLISPCFDLTTLNAHGTLSFYMTLNNAKSLRADSLYVWASVSNGKTWSRIGTLTRYNAYYSNAAWNRVDLDLSAYTGQPKVMFAFEAIGKQGTAFAIDEIQIFNTQLRVQKGVYNTTSCVMVNGAQWVDLRDDNNRLIAQINANGNDLGQVCYGVNIVTDSLRYLRTGIYPNRNDNYYFARNILVQSTVAPSAPVGIRMYYLPSEFDLTRDSIAARTGIVIVKDNLQVLDFHDPSKPDDLYLLNNDFVNGIATYKAQTYLTNNGFDYFNFSVNYLGEIALLLQKQVTGVEKKYTSVDIKLYPDPVKNELNVTVPDQQEALNYSIFNALGQRVNSGEFNDTQNKIDVSNLSAGIYWIRVGEQVMKFVKE